MCLCKGVYSDVVKQAKIHGVEISDKMADTIAEYTERFILDILEQSTEICTRNKRKIVTREDLNEALDARGLLDLIK